jgi:superfamily II DNA or RNA helicase
VLSLVLEEKTALGLAAPPAEHSPAEALSEEELVERALSERQERARTERMAVRAGDPARPWTDYAVTNKASGKTYRVALRGTERGEAYCSCPDFRKNGLGTCKHVLQVLRKVRGRFSSAQLGRPYRRRHIALHVRYGEVVELRLLRPERLQPELERIVRPIQGKAIDDEQDLVQRLRRIERLGHDVVVYPDADEELQARLFRKHVADLVAEIRRDPARHPLRRELLAVELLPYQLDGIAFAVGAGRAVLADDMGLGKTIQGVGTAELLARVAGIRRVLVVTPATLKAQWRAEIGRFCARPVRLVLGSAAERARQYESECFFTVCNYEQVLRDVLAIERVPWDLIVLDEGQRIKNWEAKTSTVVKGLRSRFALVLSGTPLENRLEELHSVVEFVDERRLGPQYRFHHRHRVVDERGRVLGYKNLADLRARIAPVLLRRTRADVLDQLPPRTTEVVRIEPTEEQLDLHGAHMRVVSSIVNKPFISEMDLLRLRKALLSCRLSANGTFLVDRKLPGFSSKMARLEELLDELFAGNGEGGRKAVLFSEWTRMLDAVEPLLESRGLEFVRLDGKVPQKKRQSLVEAFHSDPRCRLFLTTNAGSTGLNLQAADTVLNVDLPWNPAVLEQRIARAHRMGQKRKVQVYLLVTEGTIEESLLSTLSAKHDLFLAALDPDSEVDALDLVSGAEELKRRLEVLLGRRPDAPVDESLARVSELRATDLAERRRLAAAGGELLSSAFRFLGEILPAAPDSDTQRAAEERLRERLRACTEPGPNGKVELRVALPPEALDGLAATLARLLERGR